MSMCSLPYRLSFFFFNDTATTEIYTLSLHDALPILTGNLPDSKLAQCRNRSVIMRGTIPLNGRAHGILKAPARRPTQQRAGFVSGELQEVCFVNGLRIAAIFPTAGPVLQNFLHEFGHATVRVVAGAEIKRANQTLASNTRKCGLCERRG